MSRLLSKALCDPSSVILGLVCGSQVKTRYGYWQTNTIHTVCTDRKGGCRPHIGLLKVQDTGSLHRQIDVGDVGLYELQRAEDLFTRYIPVYIGYSIYLSGKYGNIIRALIMSMNE